MKTLVLLFALVPALAFAQPWWLNGSNLKADDFLAPDLAFKPAAHVDGNQIHVVWAIADGYYLYRRKFLIQAESPGLAVDPALFPQGIIKSDPYLGIQEIFTSSVDAAVNYRRRDAGAHPLQIRVTYQGCAEAGLCYPPIVKVLFPETADTPGSATPAPKRGLLSASSLAQAAPNRVRAAARGSWVSLAIIGGGIAFLLAGFVLRRGRRLDFPPA